jgi:hypothetical protein
MSTQVSVVLKTIEESQKKQLMSNKFKKRPERTNSFS